MLQKQKTEANLKGFNCLRSFLFFLIIEHLDLSSFSVTLTTVQSSCSYFERLVILIQLQFTFLEKIK